MKAYKVPTKDEVTPNNQAIFDKLKDSLGFVPNLYAYYGKNETALNDYLQLQNRKTTLSKREKEIVNLVVSQYNGCQYCLSAHTAIAGMNGFAPEQIIDVRSGETAIDDKLNALAAFTLSVVQSRGKVSNETKQQFFDAGYTEENLIDTVLNIGDKTVSNFIHNIADFAIDFPQAPALELETV